MSYHTEASISGDMDASGLLSTGNKFLQQHKHNDIYAIPVYFAKYTCACSCRRHRQRHPFKWICGILTEHSGSISWFTTGLSTKNITFSEPGHLLSSQTIHYQEWHIRNQSLTQTPTKMSVLATIQISSTSRKALPTCDRKDWRCCI